MFGLLNHSYLKPTEMSSGLPEYRREARSFTESDTPGLRKRRRRLPVRIFRSMSVALLAIHEASR
jgi:hypothetical protein